MSHRRNTSLAILLFILGIISLIGLTWMNFRFSVENPGGNDFLARWNGARFFVVEGISPYDDRVGNAAQEMIYGRPADTSVGEDLNLFVYPLYSMAFFAPFGPLEYVTARALWMTLLEISLVVLAFFSLQMSGWKVSIAGTAAVVLFSLLWYPGARTLILGQFSGIDALLMLGAMILIQRRRDVDAGLLLALSTAKPQMSFLIVIFTLLWALSVRRSRLVLSIIGGMAFLMISSMVFLPDWPIQWIRQMIVYPSYTDRIGSVVSVIASGMPGISKPLSLILYGIFGFYLFVEWILAWGRDERWYFWTALMTLVITNFVAFRTATPHYVTFLPILFLLFRSWQERWGDTGQKIAWATMILLFVGLWALFLSTVQGNAENAVLYLPLPILSLLGLWWVRWWVIHRQKMFFEEYPI